jgi:hypothetical protein
MTETSKQKKTEIWNPGLDASDVKVDEKSEPNMAPPPLMMNPIFVRIHKC